MVKQAVRPEFFSKLPSAKRSEQLDKKGITDEEQFLYGMSQTAGWDVFTKKKDILLREMDVLQENAISSGVSKEEIGENAIIINMARGVINRLWDFVDDSKEICESAGGK